MSAIKTEGCISYNGITILNPHQPTYEVQYKMTCRVTGKTEEGQRLIKADSEEAARVNFADYLKGFGNGENIQLWIGQVYL